MRDRAQRFRGLSAMKLEHLKKKGGQTVFQRFCGLSAMKRMREENGGAAAGDIASLSQYMQSKDDAPKLRCQLNPLLSLAKEIFKQGGCTEQEAIKEAWRLRKTRGVPMNDVTKPLMRFFSWCITTSDIQRDFA